MTERQSKTPHRRTVRSARGSISRLLQRPSAFFDETGLRIERDPHRWPDVLSPSDVMDQLEVLGVPAASIELTRDDYTFVEVRVALGDLHLLSAHLAVVHEAELRILSELKQRDSRP